MIWMYVTCLLMIGWFFGLTAWSGWREHHRRATLLGLLGLVATGQLGWIPIAHLPHPTAVAAIVGLPVLFGCGALLSFVTWGRLPDPVNPTHAQRYDERNHMFARASLKDHPDLLQRHHKDHPEHVQTDTIIHKLPELGEPGSTYYDPVYGAIAEAAFMVLDRSYLPISERTKGHVSPPEPMQLAAAIRFLARRYGAVDVGFTRTHPYHWYSHRGRQARNWGRIITPEHPFAIVIVVPMDPDIIRYAPALPAILESSRGYVEAAKIAHLVAEFLARFGFDAVAHVDGNYQVICAPMAQDAGLGHVGRMGIFMHHRLGPCVRLSVVTTCAELPVTTGDHRYMEAFCRICMKCADNCPTRSISFEDAPATTRGFAHWSIDQERCYTFWRRIGTDCAVCIRSCPFTKPDTLLHRLARWYIRRNPLNRWIALKLDDWFYGRNIHIASRNPDLSQF